MFILRNPAQAFTSLIKRFKLPAKLPRGHHVQDFDAAARLFLARRKEPLPGVHTLLYEELFMDGHAPMRSVMDALGMQYSPNIFHAQLKPHVIVPREVNEIPKSRPNNEHHLHFRTWQINQPFRNMNDEQAEELPSDVRAKLEAAAHALELYPASDRGTPRDFNQNL